ncbi:hypothetical protein PIB30_054461 [Stylosanthes scabra]|uniref:Uncharacterized protein n=1 Tax=Stylosanthes scabra TaxID=79078 RepID=A0ABU6UMA0_9FABA|nr:hypothetical protein [Stylosanthes scabra]
MPSVAVKLYNVFFKTEFKHRLKTPTHLESRPDLKSQSSPPILLSSTASPPNHNNAAPKPRSKHGSASARDSNSFASRHNNYGSSTVMQRKESMRRNHAGNDVVEGLNLMSNGVYRDTCRRWTIDGDSLELSLFQWQ